MKIRKRKTQGQELHDRLCDLIIEDLKKKGYETLDHYKYTSLEACGEVDIIAYKNDYILDIEVKYNHRAKNKRKAEKQLTRSEAFCDVLLDKKVFKFYAYHVGEGYKLEWIKNSQTR